MSTVSPDSVAQDQIKAFVERILRLKEEASTIKGDIREVYAEAKGNGFDKTVLGKLVGYVEKRATGAADLLEAEALFDLYLSAYDGASHTHAREDEPEHDADGVIIEPTSLQKAQRTKPQAQPVQTGPRFGSPTTNAGAVAVEAPAINQAETPAKSTAAPVSEPRLGESTPGKGASWTVPQASHADNREVVTGPHRESGEMNSGATGGRQLQPALRTGVAPGAVDTNSEISSAEAEEAGEEVVTAASSPDTQSASPDPESAADDGESRVAPAALAVTPLETTYAEPGIVVMERCPPEGIMAHPFAACWPVNSIDATGGIRESIVKQGKFILDGRGRYFAARDAGIEYPVVQYDGHDVLGDIIRWNLASRPKLSENQRRLIAQKLAKVEPGRADDVMQLFELHREAAE